MSDDTATAVLRFNSRHSLEVFRGPSVLEVEEPGQVRISLGSILVDVDGPLILETTSAAYLDELISALQAARARGIVQADMGAEQ
jgi:hypothetical protein